MDTTLGPESVVSARCAVRHNSEAPCFSGYGNTAARHSTDAVLSDVNRFVLQRRSYSNSIPIRPTGGPFHESFTCSVYFVRLHWTEQHGCPNGAGRRLAEASQSSAGGNEYDCSRQR